MSIITSTSGVPSPGLPARARRPVESEPVDQFQPLAELPHIAVAEVERVDHPALAEKMLAQLRAWPQLTAVISVSPQDRDGQSEIMVASRPGAIAEGRHQGVFEVVERLASSDSIKAQMACYPSQFRSARALNSEGTLHELRLPGLHDGATVKQALVEGAQPNRHDQIQAVLEQLPKGKRVALIVAGPPGAGKSGVIERLQELSQQSGRRLAVLEGDMYFKKDRTGLPMTEMGTPYWDHPAYMDMNRFKGDIARLIQEGEADTPIYQFEHVEPGQELGVARPQPTRRVSLGQDDILLIDSLHAANPDVISHLEGLNLEHATIYLDSPTAEIRMVRRMVRDYAHRGGWLANESMAFWDATTWKGEVEFVRPTILQLDPGHDVFLVTRFPKDVEMTRRQIDERIKLMNTHGLPPTYEGFAAPPEQLPALALEMRQQLESRVLAGEKLSAVDEKTLTRLRLLHPQ